MATLRPSAQSLGFGAQGRIGQRSIARDPSASHAKRNPIAIALARGGANCDPCRVICTGARIVVLGGLLIEHVEGARPQTGSVHITKDRIREQA